MEFKCQYCEKNYTTKGNLLKHQRTAKYCLKIQETLLGDDKIEKTETFDCNYCSKKFSQKTHLNRHIKICSEKIKKEYEDLKNQLLIANETIKQLKIENEIYKKDKETLNEIAKQPRQVNNNKIIVANLDLSRDKLASIIDSGLAEEHLFMGQKGIAHFAYNNFLKDDEGKLKYVCTDPSRQIFQFKNKEGDLEKDVRASKLTKALCDADIKHKSHEILAEFIRDGDNESALEYIKNYQNIRDMESDNSDFSKELSSLVI